jgi:RND family efflux transporter MFP subunit
MNSEARLQLRWPVAIAVAALCMSIGAIASYLFVRPAATSSTEPGPLAAARSSEATASLHPTPLATPDGTPLPDVDITLSDEAIKRAGIVVAAVESGPMVTTLRLPAVVEPNAYKQINVTPLVSGRITSVRAELGAQVRQGQTLATVFSPELVEAQTRFIAASAELEAHERELARTEKLVEIGSASRQELERIHAEHTAQRTNVESARSRLELLGLSRKAVDALTAGQPVNANIEVPAPISGVVTERVANVGLNVDPSARMFTVVDLSTVWIVGNLYEQDFSRVRVGDRATVVSAAYPDLKVEGTISYIDPQVSLQTRTAKVRVEVSNPRQELRLGMLAEVQIDSANRTPVTLVPKDAVQNVADRSFVYIDKPDASNQFTEREVQLGPASGDRVQILSGLTLGDRVVVEGSFFLRAERERLGLRQASRGSGEATPVPDRGGQRPTAGALTAKILVTEKGFEPDKISLPAGIAARVTFLRTTDKTCATEVVFPSLNIKRALPLNQPVEIELTPTKSADIAFICGMNMFKGLIMMQ